MAITTPRAVNPKRHSVPARAFGTELYSLRSPSQPIADKARNACLGPSGDG
jgi:hypothetical protein